jgi:hypothetical protein
MEIEIIILSEINKVPKGKYCIFSLMCRIQAKKKTINVNMELFGGITRR